MDILKNIENQMDKLIRENADLIRKCEVRIDELKVEIETAGEDMAAATDTVDTAAFKTAKKRKDDAQIEMDMLHNSLKKLKEEPLMKAAEFEAMRKSLVAEQEKYTNDRKKKFAPLVKSMLSDMDAAGELDNRVENDLMILFKKVMRISGGRDQKLNKDLEKYRFREAKLDSYPIYWFLSNLKDLAEEIDLK